MRKLPVKQLYIDEWEQLSDEFTYKEGWHLPKHGHNSGYTQQDKALKANDELSKKKVTILRKS
jgi:hypothetical protein